jgi:hypothetical protein
MADTEVYADEILYRLSPDWDWILGCGRLHVDVWCVHNDHRNIKRLKAVEEADQGADDSVCARTQHSGENVVKACAIEQVTVFPPDVNQQRAGYKWGCCQYGNGFLDVVAYAKER